MEAYFYHPRRKTSRRRKVAWVLERPQFETAIPVEKRVAVALWRLATGNSYRTTGLVFGVRRCTALKLKDEFCSALLTTAKGYIKFPKGEAESRRAIEEEQKWNACTVFPI